MIEVSIEPRELPAGREFDLEIRFSNTGRRPCTDIAFLADLPRSFLLLRGRNQIEIPELGAGKTRVHRVTVQARVPGDFAVTSSDFSYRDERGTPVREAGFRAGLTVKRAPPPQRTPDLGVNVVSGPLALGTWDKLRLRVRSHSPTPLRGIRLALDGRIQVAAPGPKARLPDLAAGQETEVSFTVCPTAAGRHVPAQVVVNYTDGSGRPRVQHQPLSLAVGSQENAEGDTAVPGTHPVLVLTALDLEYNAVRAHLTGLRKRRHPQGTLFETGQLSSGGEITIALTGEGNIGAAVLAERAMSMFGPQAMLFVGVAGALKDDIELGDVVVGTRIYAFHGSKEEDEGVWARPRSWEAPHELEQLAHSIGRDGSWVRYLLAPAPGRLPEVHFKPIAAGEVLLASRVTETAQRLRRVYNDAAAIEMESAGVAQASQFNHSLPALIIRGISDRADGTKRALDREGGQPRAAAHAAAFAVALAAEFIASHASGPGGTP